jgi:hypothetical protein
VFHAGYQAAGNDWLSSQGALWPDRFNLRNEDGRRCIEALTPRQRELIGIPAPGHPFWNHETIDGFSRRYPNADPEPYLSALS